jgi:Flp pilus assembly protein TadG
MIMKTILKEKFAGILGAESGGVAVTTALLMVVFLGLAAYAVDMGHMAMVKSELQRTADAAALAGAMGLAPYTGSFTDPTPNWVQGQSKAHEMINKTANQANNQTFSLTDGTVAAGYWLLKPPAGYVQTLSQARPVIPTQVPEPAISVTLTRDVTLFFAPILGLANPRTVTATAIAMLPEAYQIRNIPPIAVDQDTVYNNVNGTLIMDISDQDIKIQSNKGVAGWFNLDGGNSVPSVLYSQPLKSGSDQIYLVPGTKATLTDLIAVGQTIVLPVVDAVDQKVWKNIAQFAAFKVTDLSSNTMSGHFVAKFIDPFVDPVAYNGNNSPVWGTPKLVQ